MHGIIASLHRWGSQAQRGEVIWLRPPSLNMVEPGSQPRLSFVFCSKSTLHLHTFHEFLPSLLCACLPVSLQWSSFTFSAFVTVFLFFFFFHLLVSSIDSGAKAKPLWHSYLLWSQLTEFNVCTTHLTFSHTHIWDKFCFIFQLSGMFIHTVFPKQIVRSWRANQICLFLHVIHIPTTQLCI